MSLMMPIEKETGRLEAFSDGVFSIAITLLVLDIHVPHVGHGQLLSALAAQWPTYLSFLVSFSLIGIIWANHHTVFKQIVRTDHPLLFLNLLLLLSVVVIPFSTSLLAEYIRGTIAEQRVAAIVYSSVFLAMAIAFNLLWNYARRHPKLMGPHVHSQATETITRRFRYGPLWYVLGIVIAYFSVAASLALYLALSLYFALPHKDDAA